MTKRLRLTLLLCLFCNLFIINRLHSQSEVSSDELMFRTPLPDELPALQMMSDENIVSLSVGNRYFLKEMMTEQLSASFVHKRSRFFLSLQHIGFSRFGEFSGSIGYGVKVAPWLAFALNFHYSMFHAHTYLPTHSITFDCSVLACANDKIGILLHAHNPANLHYGIVGESLMPITLNTLLYYKIHKSLFLSAQLTKTIPGDWNVGLLASCAIRSLAFTGELSLRTLSIDVACHWHSFLFSICSKYDYRTGFSQSASVRFFWK